MLKQLFRQTKMCMKERGIMDKGEGIEAPNKERKMMTDELRNGERDNKIKA